MAENLLFQLRAGAFKSAISIKSVWGKQVIRIVLQKKCDIGYQEISLSNSYQIDDLIALLEDTKRAFFSI